MKFGISIIILIITIIIPVLVTFIYKAIYNKHINSVLNGKEPRKLWVSPSSVLLITFAIEFLVFIRFGNFNSMNNTEQIDTSANNVTYYAQEDNSLYLEFNGSDFIPSEYTLSEYNENNFKVYTYFKNTTDQNLPENIVVIKYKGSETPKVAYIETNMYNQDGAKSGWMVTKDYSDAFYVVINKSENIKSIELTAKMFSELPTNPKEEDSLEGALIESINLSYN